METGAELHGVKKQRKYFGKLGVADFLYNQNNLQVEGNHEKALIFPIEEEVYEKLGINIFKMFIDYKL